MQPPKPIGLIAQPKAIQDNATNKGNREQARKKPHKTNQSIKLTIWFKFCCDIAPLAGGGGPVGVVADIDCWGAMPPGPILPLRGAGLGAPPGADMALIDFRL